jgi:membrane protease subunit (stomatin/prohibitin family)
MTIAIGILIIVAALAFVAAPFFAGEPAGDTAAPVARGQLERQKLEAYAAIKEAEFDYRMGKLSDADFGALREKYGAQALQAISALDEAQSTPPRQVGHRRPVRIAFCPACGHGVPPRANFCPACGRSLQEAVA